MPVTFQRCDGKIIQIAHMYADRFIELQHRCYILYALETT